MDDALEITEQVVTGGLNQAQKYQINGIFYESCAVFRKEMEHETDGEDEQNHEDEIISHGNAQLITSKPRSNRRVSKVELGLLFKI